MEPNNHVSLETVTGMVCIFIAMCFQCVCLFIMRIVNRTEPRSRTTIIRMWIHMSSALDQLSFLVFHVHYNVFATNFDDIDTCIVLRFLSSFTSTLFTMWVLVLTVFYFTMTVKPSKCYSFHAQFLSHCTTWVWTCTSCLMYLILANLIKMKYSSQFIDCCWNNITKTIHFYSTYGNELIPFVFAILLATLARCRFTKQRQLYLLQINKEPLFVLEVATLKYKVNTVVILCIMLFTYYLALTFRYLALDSGSDWSLMIIQSLKGFAVGIVLCVCDKGVINVLKCKYDTPEELADRNGDTELGDIYPELT